MTIKTDLAQLYIKNSPPKPKTETGGSIKGPNDPNGPNVTDGGTDEPNRGSFVYDKMMMKIQSEPEIRTDLVEKYKNQIKSGEYNIDNKKLSSKLIKESIESGK